MIDLKKNKKLNLESNIHKNCIYDLIWLNKTEIACGGGNKVVNIIDANTFEIISTLKGHTESVKSLTCVKTNTSIIASGARDGAILIYDLRYNKKSSDEAYHSINTIQTAHYNAGVAISTPKSKQNSSNISPIASILFQNENLIISAGATDNLIKVWDLRKTYTNRITNPQPLLSFKNEVSTKGYSNLTITNCNTRLFANCMNNTIYEYDLCSYKCINKNNDGFNLHKNSSNFVKSCLSIDNNFLLTGSSDSNVYIYPINYKNCVNVLKLEGAHQNETTCVAWSPHDINQLMTCSDDNSIRVWNVKRNLIVQENQFKVTQTDAHKQLILTDDDNIKLFNQKFYYPQKYNSSSVYNDYIFMNYQAKFNRKACRNYLSNVSDQYNIKKNSSKVLLSPTSNLPVNLNKPKIVDRVCLTPKQLGSVQTRIPFSSSENTPIQQQRSLISNSTSKKRPLDKIFNEMLNLSIQETPPSSKRRLILDVNNTKNIQTQNSKSMTILDYFSPKSAKK